MRKKLLVLGLATLMAVSVTACGSGSGAKENKTATTESVKKATYQSVLDDYSKKLKDATPKLVDEYKKESEKISGDINALADLSNKKIKKLADICNDGVSEMAKIKMDNGDDKKTYENWAAKLQKVYQDYAAKIQDAYMESAK